MADVLLANGVDRNVMVAIDESDYSHYALMWVLDNLKESVERSTLLIFMAHPPPRPVSTFQASLSSARMYCSVSPTPDFVKSVEANNKKLTLAYLDKAKEICANRGVRAETVADVGDPKVAICDAVLKYNVSLLVMGERGIGKIRREGLKHGKELLDTDFSCDLHDGSNRECEQLLCSICQMPSACGEETIIEDSE